MVATSFHVFSLFTFETQLGPALCDFMDTATVMGTECIVEVHTPAVRGEKRVGRSTVPMFHPSGLCGSFC